jgi:hypothetical protein
VSDRADTMTTEPAEPRDANLDRFDSVLRALVTYGLVEQESENGDDRGDNEAPGRTSRWRLIPAVQRRLEALVPPAPPADKLIYFGHRCASCGQHAPTRMHSGVLLCDACRESVSS